MRGRILFVDDEPEILNAVKLYLENEDFEVHVTTDGKHALELAEALKPDLIILDIMMPAVDGVQVCRQLRSRTRTRMIPIIFLTARESVEDKISGLEAGGVDYITKPFNNQELLARIKAHIRQSRETLAGHPVTGLPGAVAVEEEVNRRLQQGEVFTAVFVEMDYFHEYCEAYGISRGDRLLGYVSKLLEEEAGPLKETGVFLGQPSYESFVLLSRPERARSLCSEIIERFEAGKAEFYMEQHRQAGELIYYDYRGSTVRAPLVKLALGGVCNSHRFVATYTALAEWAAQAVLKARSKEKSAFVIEE